jgi:hypothetical protein
MASTSGKVAPFGDVVPDEGQQLDLLADDLPDESTRNLILMANPEAL